MPGGWLNFYDSMLKLEETHPDPTAHNDFKNGWFSVYRTRKSFPSTPIDLTLGQTINADVASQHLGISTFTDSISARQHWADSHFLRTSILSNLFNQIGLTKKDDVSEHRNLTGLKRTMQLSDV